MPQLDRTAIVCVSHISLSLAQTIASELLGEKKIFTIGLLPTEVSSAEVSTISSIADLVATSFSLFDAWIFIGAMGICVRSIAPYITDKHHDPAVVNVDSTGRYVVSVLSGHVGGANDLTCLVASAIGAEPVVTTQSDRIGLWALDTLANTYGWKAMSNTGDMNRPISLFVNGARTALILETAGRGEDELERTCPPHVHLYYRFEDVCQEDYDLLLVVSARYNESQLPMIAYYPPALVLGVGCRKQCASAGILAHIVSEIRRLGYAPEAVGGVSTIDIKANEPLIADIARSLGNQPLHIYTGEELQGVEVPNPSDKVFAVTGSYGVAEASARKSAGMGPVVIEKQKGQLSEGNDFTFSVAQTADSVRAGHIEIVGAGPGDPDLVSVRGRQFLEKADLILYAGSLVPRELTACAKAGATVRSSAAMNLEEQFELMADFYRRGKLVVRLHTGDPCIYGAIQEQMALFDHYGMRYHITPGISSFQAAAAALRSQFTIPERTQTIILTRGEGRTPMPEREKLHLLAQSQSTMCIFLSAAIVDDVQRELLVHYPPETPVAACYRLTWPDEKIFRGTLAHLSEIVKENNLTLTTMIVVGEAIDNREGLSRLYADEFKHLFRT